MAYQILGMVSCQIFFHDVPANVLLEDVCLYNVKWLHVFQSNINILYQSKKS